MSTPYIGEIRMFGGNFAPLGWALCDGRQLAIGENEALFTLIGTTYGGDGQVTFAVPDLRSRVPLHVGQGNGLSPQVLGQTGGAETVTLQVNQLPQHTHNAGADATGGTQPNPQSAIWAASGLNQFSSNSPNTTMNAAAIGNSGGNQPHENMLPFLALNFIIALEGIFPTPG
jgi:microcystin-dependent protein